MKKLNVTRETEYLFKKPSILSEFHFVGADTRESKEEEVKEVTNQLAEASVEEEGLNRPKLDH